MTSRPKRPAVDASANKMKEFIGSKNIVKKSRPATQPLSIMTHMLLNPSKKGFIVRQLPSGDTR